MSAIQEVFVRCRREGRAAFIPFLMAGDPDLSATAAFLDALAIGGSDIIELGIPFSDPIADGPVNQRAAQRSLAAGTKLAGILDLVARKRIELGIPIVLFTYFNPIHARGGERFAAEASAAGVDGVLCVDLPPEEGARELLPALRRYRLDSVFLLAPTSTAERIQKVGEASTGFVYYVSRTGVTGEQTALPVELAAEVGALRQRLALPVAVGFGISSPEQVAAVAAIADGVVVGSALVRLVEEHGAAAAPALAETVRQLTAPLRRAGKGVKA